MLVLLDVAVGVPVITDVFVGGDLDGVMLNGTKGGVAFGLLVGPCVVADNKNKCYTEKIEINERPKNVLCIFYWFY